MLTAMDDIPPRAVWIDRFVMHTRALGVRAEPELIEAMAAELWPDPWAPAARGRCPGRVRRVAAARLLIIVSEPTEFWRLRYTDPEIRRAQAGA